jgi:hypothetical protein
MNFWKGILSEKSFILKNSKNISGDFKVSGADVQGFPYFLMDLTSASDSADLLYQWIRKGKVRASIKVSLRSDKAISSPNLPFGGFWISGPVHSEELERFICKILDHLKSLNCRRIEITQAPKPYEKYSELVGNILFKAGFGVLNIQTHQFFIGKKKILKEVQKHQEIRKRPFKHKDISVYRGPITDFGFIRDIRDWNSEKGYSVPFDEARLIGQASLFPDRYFQISVFHKNEPVAHAMAVKLVPESLYYYLSAICPKPDLSRCGELIIQNLFALAVEQKSELIDLGTSEVDSELNHGLIFFKSRFSNGLNNKITWQYNF